MIYAEMVDTVVHKAASFGQFGTPTFVTTSRPCFIEYRTRVVQDIHGNMVVSGAKLYMRPLTIIGTTTGRAADTIHYEDKMTFDGADHQIIKIGKGKTISHTWFLEVWVQ